VSATAAFADSAGVRIAYELRGTGAPLVLIHGLAYDRYGWGRLPELLAERFRVLLLDNRGVGESDAPEGPYAVSQLAADVVAVLDDAGLERTNVLGVSLGGYIAQEVALSYPRRVERLVLCSTSPGGPNAYPMPEAGLQAFARFPTLEREAGLRLMVENSLGERGLRELPELAGRSTPTGSSMRRRSPPGRRRRTPARPSTRTTASAGSSRRRSSSTAAQTTSSTRATRSCSAG